jgi:ElaB/YqjD/DUF883 family membrane-anchored ribosome-binding protein
MLCYRLLEETTMSEVTAAQADRLMSDLKLVIADAEALLKSTGGDVGEAMADARGRIEARLAEAKAHLLQLQQSATQQAKAAGRAADDYVHHHPWQAVGIAAGIGLVVGLLIGRR